MICQWQTGLLVLRECGQPAAGGCSLCGRMLCMAHAVPGSSGMACPQCAASTDGYQETEDTEIAGARDQYYQQYGQPGYFTANDSAAMGATGSPVTPFRQDDYDPMES